VLERGFIRGWWIDRERNLGSIRGGGMSRKGKFCKKKLETEY